MSKLFLMMRDTSVHGKSYWAHHHLNEKTKYISRDEIRFSMLKDEDDYFAKEKEVFKEFCKQIDIALQSYDNVIADATHLNFASRNKTLRNIKSKIDEINVIFIDTPLNIALERNAKRTGRKLVPEEVIKNMYNSLMLPDELEGINKTYIVDNATQKIKIIEHAVAGPYSI